MPKITAIYIIPIKKDEGNEQQIVIVKHFPSTEIVPPQNGEEV